MTRERTIKTPARLHVQEKSVAIVGYVKTYHHVSPIDFSFLPREKVVGKNAKKASKQGKNNQLQHTRAGFSKLHLEDWDNFEEPLTRSFC